MLVSGEEVKSKAINMGLAVVRIFAGLAIAFGHGLGKIPPSAGFIESVGNLGFPLPSVFGWAAGISEFFGGLLLAFGLFTRPSTIFMAFTMAVAAFIRHAEDPFSVKEKAFLYMVIFILFLLSGSGKYGIDHFIRKKLS